MSELSQPMTTMMLIGRRNFSVRDCSCSIAHSGSTSAGVTSVLLIPEDQDDVAGVDVDMALRARPKRVMQTEFLSALFSFNKCFKWFDKC